MKTKVAAAILIVSILLASSSLTYFIYFAGDREYGISIHAISYYGEYSEKYISIVKSTGASWIRTDWSMEFRKMDKLVSNCKKYDISILAILDIYTIGKKQFSRNDWKETVEIVVSRYRNDVDAWEVWNEPDASNQWYGYLNGSPESYTNMLMDTYKIIKKYTTAPVLFAGLSTSSPVWKEFLERCYDLGAGNYCDAQAIHFYCLGAAFPIEIVQIIKSVKDITGKNIWVTEIGFSAYERGEKAQARNLKIMINAIPKSIDKVFVYCLMDYPEKWSPSPHEAYFGLIRMDMSTKPSYFAIKELAR